MRHPFAPCLLALLLAGCAPSAASTPDRTAATPPADPYARCEREAEPARCAAAVEAELLAGSGGRASRRGDTLRVRTADGRAVPFADDGARHVAHRYHGRVEPLRASLLRVQFLEGGAWVLVSDATGDETRLIGPPLVSPGGTRFAALSLDLVAGHDPNGMQVWRVTEHGARLEWGLDGGQTWGASDGAWRGEGELEFTRHAVVPPNPEPTTTRMRATTDGVALRVEPVERNGGRR